MSKEIYRSYEGFLDVENPDGFIVRENSTTYEVEHLSIRQCAVCPHFRFPMEELPESFDWGSEQAQNWLVIMYQNIEHGHIDGATVMHKGVWYSPKKIIDRNIKLAQEGKIPQKQEVVYNWRATAESNRRYAVENEA